MRQLKANRNVLVLIQNNIAIQAVIPRAKRA